MQDFFKIGCLYKTHSTYACLVRLKIDTKEINENIIPNNKFVLCTDIIYTDKDYFFQFLYNGKLFYIAYNKIKSQLSYFCNFGFVMDKKTGLPKVIGP